ncbi:MAG: methylated-DNA--[protein]-cysteine S-methyltransferase [Muribaculaceae bacterium]|nr:methylated-DNA--[protein]-cysteine S-methyltransferase [Muribaculaceae bacterium]MDE6026489.1 methylated-DNA--[protein]-cysteine S-methyltransferase [Muribaculaceae bacterium]
MLLIKDIVAESLKIRIGIRQSQIVFVGFPDYISDGRGSAEWLARKFEDVVVFADDPLLAKAEEEIGEYLRGERRRFDLPVRHEGSGFRRMIWKELDKIPYGTTVTYSDIASSIGREGSCRAVGNAVGANMVSILTPCHRVKGKNGEGGFAWGLDVKRLLQECEKGRHL